MIRIITVVAEQAAQIIVCLKPLSRGNYSDSKINRIGRRNLKCISNPSSRGNDSEVIESIFGKLKSYVFQTPHH